MTENPHAGHTFHPGEAVRLALGPYQGTVGIFVSLRDDPKWADIREPNGRNRNHPLEWMAQWSGDDNLDLDHPRAPGPSGSQDSAKRTAIERWEGEGGSAVSRPLIHRRPSGARPASREN